MQIVHPVGADAVEPWLAALSTALLSNPFDDDFPRRVQRWQRRWLPDRVWGVQDRGRWVGTLATEARMMTVPGAPGSPADLRTDAVTAVSVAATHRRRGLLRQMIGQSLRAAADRGDAVSILVAAEWPIYGRYGYAPAARAADLTLHTRRSGAQLDADPAGAVRQVEPGELHAHAAGIFACSRGAWSGQVDRSPQWWSMRLGADGYEPISAGRGVWIMHESDAGPDGLLAWKVTRDFELDGRLGAVEVTEFAAASDLAYRNLWAYLAGLDIISEVSLPARPVEEPIRWLLRDGRALAQTHTGDHTWLRLLDVPAALSARGYAVPGELVLDVVDDGGFATGRYRLTAAADGAECTRTTRSADLVVSQRALAGAYLGDHSLRTLAVAGGVEEATPGALARADALFATAARPWNATMF